MGVRDFEGWLERPAGGDAGKAETAEELAAEELAAERDATAVKARFRSLWQDMRLHVEERGYGHQANRWRLAAYAVWYCTPRELRPVQFQRELATLLGMADDELFRKWRKQCADLFDDGAVTGSVRSLILENMPDVIMASIVCARQEGPQGFQDRQMLAKIARVLPGSTVQVEGGATPIATRGTLTVEHTIDGDSAETIFDILAAIGSVESGAGDAEDDEVHSADADA